MIGREAIGLLLLEAKKLTQHNEYVIIGSLSVLGACIDPPPSMILSVDVDLYPRLDPGRASEIGAALGQSSSFEEEHGIYADAVLPALAALPEDWELRLRRIEFEGGLIGFFLDPDDAAVSKLARSEPRDLRWVRAGLRAGLLNAQLIESRMASAAFLDQAEHDRARDSLHRQVAATKKQRNRGKDVSG
jgi:hypothetical protein